MIYSLRNNNTIVYSDLTKVKEIVYNATEFSTYDLVEATKKDKGMRVVYDLSAIKEIEKVLSDIKDLPKVVDGMVFRVANLDDLDLLLSKELPVFCGPNNAASADSLDKMRVLCEKGVTDVYVTGQLAFQMTEARALADRFGVYIRIIPNIAGLSGFTMAHVGVEENLTAFWVRPNDIHLYEPFVDIVEFFGLDGRQRAFYDVYEIDKNWRGELGQIIVGLYGINNKGLIEDFTKARLNCGKKCLLDKCHSCFKYKIMGNTIAENKLEIDLEESI